MDDKTKIVHHTADDVAELLEKLHAVSSMVYGVPVQVGVADRQTGELLAQVGGEEE